MSSPPSPEFDRPPIAFIAIARASWASGDKAPSDIPAVSNLFSILLDDSTCSIGIEFLFFRINKSLRKLGSLELTKEENFL